MGLNKKYINTDKTIRALENKTLNKLYNYEILIFEGDYSSKVYELYKQGLIEDTIIDKLKKLK